MRLICGVVCYFLAKKRNKNERLAFALGFLLGIFALAHHIFIAARGSTSERGDYVKCKECDEIFVNTKKFCPKCKQKTTKKTTKKA